MNQLINDLSLIPSVRRVVQLDGAVIPLLINDEDSARAAKIMLQHGAEPVGANFDATARAAGMTILWDRVGDQIRNRVMPLHGVIALCHGWSDETEEVKVGFEKKKVILDGEEGTSGMNVYADQLVYPEGVYYVVLGSQDEAILESAVEALSDLPEQTRWNLQFCTQGELPEGVVEL